MAILALLTVGWVRRSSVRVRRSSVGGASTNKKSRIMAPNLYKKPCVGSDKGVMTHVHGFLSIFIPFTGSCKIRRRSSLSMQFF